jgi:methionyl-tRNA formyltransferase
VAAAEQSRRRLVLLGDGRWACAALRHLVLHHDVVAVVERLHPTDDSFARTLRSLDLASTRFPDINHPDAVSWLASHKPDLLLSVSYDQIFTAPLLGPDCPPVLNLHAGNPGTARGRAVLTWQLLDGAGQVDVGVMRVTRGIDRGPLLALVSVPLDGKDDYGAALDKVCASIPGLLDAALGKLVPGTTGAESDRDAATVAVYHPRRLPGDEWLDWTRGSRELLRQVRALAPPNCGARTRLGGRSLRVLRAEACPDHPAGTGAFGAVVGKARRRGVLVRTGDGALWLTDLRDEDGSPFPLSGLRLSDRLGGSLLAEVELLRGRVALLEERLSALEGGAP